ncbi:RHS repeat-associated core domain-containing protein [Lysobacter tyrosinilyticus]
MLLEKSAREMLLALILLLSLCWSGSASAAMYSNQMAAYDGCMASTKLNYEARIADSKEYRCRRSGPNLNSYVGEIWLHNCDGCAYFWSGYYGVGEWPYVSFELPKNLGPGTGACCAAAPRGNPPHGNDAGNPINVATGNKHQREVDLELSGLLGFVRQYNSYGAFQQYGLGAAWTHTYSKRIEYSAAQYNGRVVKLHRPTGGYLLFLKQQDGSWLPDTDVFDTLATNKDANGTEIGWTYTNRSTGEVEVYDTLGRLLTISNRAGDTASLEYNGGVVTGTAQDLLLTRITDRAGRSLTFHYDASSRLDQITDASGQVYGYSYDSQGMLSGIAYPGGATKEYLYNETTYTAGANLPLALTGIVDESGQRFATFKYDTSGRAVSTEHAGGVEKNTVAYSGDTATVTDPLGNPQYRNFVTHVGVKKLTYLLNQCSTCPTSASTYSFDSNLHLDNVKDFNGTISDHDRSVDDLETQLIEAKGRPTQRKTQTDWDSSLRMPLERRIYDAANVLVGKQTYTYNARGQILTATSVDPVTNATRTSTTTYCEQADVTAGTCPVLGLVTSINGPRTDINDITTYTYYPSDDATCATSPTTCPHRKGDLWMVQDALGNIAETLRYDGAGRVLSIKDANGVVTDFEYHSRGWLIARKARGTDGAIETDDQITRIEYYPTGLVKKTALPDGSNTSYTYDAAHRLTDITDGVGSTIHYTLDNAGNRTKEDTKDSAGTLVRTLSRVFNKLGQLQTNKDAYNHGTGYIYDANGNADKVTDALSRVTDSDYDALNRLTQTIQNVGELNVTTQFKYDARDNLTEVIDPKNLSTKYTYNGLGDLKQLDSPDTGVTSYTYDSAGNRKTQTDARNVTATYGYDALNRLVSVSYPDSSLNVGYSYDIAATACAGGETFAAGRLSLITDGSGSTQYCYDRFGQMVRKVQTTAGQNLTVRYGYTKAGQLSSVTYPDGTVADYVRDNLGRTTQVGVTRPGVSRQILLTSASYYPFGPASEWVFGNGRLFQRTLNQNYQPGVVQDQSTAGLSLGYEFDAVGNLVKLRNGNQSEPPLRRYVYDALNRLTETHDSTTDALLQGYGYDGTGNRISATNGGVTTAYTLATNSHRLTDVGGVARTYDSVGNTTAIGGAAREFVYSDANRMSAAKQGGVTAMSYAYNGKGEQVRRSIGANGTATVYDEGGHWLGDYDNAGNPTRQVVWLDDLPVGLIVGAAATNQPLNYIEADALGTPRTVIESTRNVAVWSWALTGEVFGKDAPNEDVDGDSVSLAFNLRFPGQRYDAASGLNQNYFRDYDPSTGSYPESDPIGLNGGISTYAYSGSNPLTQADPFGLDWIEYNGRQMSLYGGKLGDRSQLKRQCAASSGQNVPGYFDYRNSAYQNVPGYGPTPEGLYSVNLVPNPNRIANVAPGGYLTPNPNGGIERIPAGGEQSWGNWRARLMPAPGTNTYDRDNMYLHDSTKGETHGCIETCSGLLDNLLQLRAAGVKSIDVFVDYPGNIRTGH